MNSKDSHIEHIEIICEKIRSSILKLKEKTYLFQAFPDGCCRDTSLLVGEILKKSGYEKVDFCHKECDDISVSHSWLEYRNYIIDLTLYQFEQTFPPIYIVSNYDRSVFHKNYIKEAFSLKIAGFDYKNLVLDISLIECEL